MSHDTEPTRKINVPTPDAMDVKDVVHPEKTARTDRYGRGKQIGVVATIAGVLAAGGGGFIAYESQHKAPEDNNPNAVGPIVPGSTESATPNTVVTPSVSPSENPTSPTYVPGQTPESTPSQEASLTTESLRLDAALPAKDLAQEEMNLTTEWSLAGATDGTIGKTMDDYYAFTGAAQDFPQAEATKNAELFTTALFPDNWQSNPDMVAYRQRLIDTNATNIQTNMKRELQHQPLWSIKETVVSAQELQGSNGQRTIKYTSEANTVNDTSSSTVTAEYTETYDISDGTARLIKWDSNIITKTN